MEDLTADDLRAALSYDQSTGDFRWISVTSNRVKIGAMAGSISKLSGHLTIRLFGRLYQAHRLAWLHSYGSWPKGEIDHIDTIKLNNPIKNLRDATSAVNQQNIRKPRASNKSGYQGVVWIERLKKWRAGLTKSKKFVSLGFFDSPEGAYQAYVNGKRLHHEGNTL